MGERRIVLLGTTGDGKSSCGNVIVGEEAFPTGCSPTSISEQCSSKTKSIDGKEIKVIDTPGFFYSKLSSDKLNSAILRCIIECAPGPHAFVIVLKVGRYTEHEIETVEKVTKSFGEKALKYAVVLFTFGDQLGKDETIQDFVKQSTELQDLVNKCGGRVHVIDNKYWNEQQDGYRSNRVQVEKLLNTIEEMVKENGGDCCTNEMLQAVQETVEAQCEDLCAGRRDAQDINMRERARQNVYTKLSVRLAGIGAGVLLGALFGAVAGVAAVMTIMNELGTGTVSRATIVAMATAGAIRRGVTGYQAAEGAETMADAETGI